MAIQEDHSTPIAPELTSLSEAFYDDVHGTAKSLQSLKEHSDFSRWLKNNKLNDGDLVTVERKLQLYQACLICLNVYYHNVICFNYEPFSSECGHQYSWLTNRALTTLTILS